MTARGGLREQPSILGCLPVHLAAIHGQEECLGILLTVLPEAINHRDEQEKTPLFLAVENDSVACVEYLLEKGADPNIGNTDRETPLHKACEHDNVDVVCSLLQYGAELDRACRRGWTPLHEAVCHNSVEICETLLRAGASLHRRNTYGITPFFLAAQAGCPEALALLINRGADVNFQMSDGATALFEASKNGYEEVVKLLLTHRADANRPTKTNLLPIHTATQHGHIEIVKLLLPVTSAERVRRSGISPLHLAAQYNEDDILEALIQAGYDVNALLSHDQSRMYQDRRTTALYFAVNNSNEDAAELLLEAGADPNLDKFNPLLVAVRQGNVQMARLLLEHGADVNAGMPNCQLAFPAAVLLCLRYPAMLKLLLDHGCHAPACFQCRYGADPHPHPPPPATTRAGKDDLGLDREEPCVQFCEAVSAPSVGSWAGPIVSLLLDYVGHVPLCSRLTQLLHGHPDWASLTHRTKSPPSLKQLCRLGIRQETGLQRLGVLGSLPLPSRLIRYLQYNDE
ncbi:ankyrin repeat and SOCS box protein 2-like isoform X2 [Engraulis encrasicolus]